MTLQHQVPARREFKYLVPRERIPALRAAIDGICRRDSHSGPDGTYRLRSLYLDTWDMRLFKANGRQAPIRFKARIRSYPEGDVGGPVFAELKGRNGDIIVKTRAKLPAEGWQSILRGAPPGAHHSAALDDWVWRMHRFDLQPICHVDYRREAWVSTVDEYARVSIDTRIECRIERDWTLHGDDRMHPTDSPLHPHTHGSVCVVELKWANAAPRWMMNLVQGLDLLRQAFSKYGYSVLALHDDHFVDYRRTNSAWA